MDAVQTHSRGVPTFSVPVPPPEPKLLGAPVTVIAQRDADDGVTLDVVAELPQPINSSAPPTMQAKTPILERMRERLRCTNPASQACIETIERAMRAIAFRSACES